jgi:hypothetical protein
MVASVHRWQVCHRIELNEDLVAHYRRDGPIVQNER